MFQSQGLSTPSTANPMKDFEVTSPPDDSVSALAFSPATLPQNFLVAGSWDNNVIIFLLDLKSCKQLPLINKKEIALNIALLFSGGCVQWVEYVSSYYHNDGRP